MNGHSFIIHVLKYEDANLDGNGKNNRINYCIQMLDAGMYQDNHLVTVVFNSTP